MNTLLYLFKKRGNCKKRGSQKESNIEHEHAWTAWGCMLNCYQLWTWNIWNPKRPSSKKKLKDNMMNPSQKKHQGLLLAMQHGSEISWLNPSTRHQHRTRCNCPKGTHQLIPLAREHAKLPPKWYSTWDDPKESAAAISRAKVNAAASVIFGQRFAFYQLKFHLTS